MTSREEQIAQLEAAVAAQEALRPTLGDAVVELTLATLRAQLAALRAQATVPASPGGEPTSEQALARLRHHLPPELADKMRAGGPVESERKQVTVLFADIVGFTALGEWLGDEEVAALIDEVLRELAAVVYQYEGYIDKFVGDAVMAVFGAPVAHEDDPERALRAALAMRERLEQLNRRWADRLDAPLELHVGINTGPVIAGTVGPDLRLAYTVMGDTVNTAARLQDAAAPGQILVSRDTYRLTHEAFTFLALEPIRVKGKRQPLTIYELERARLRPGKSRGLQDLAPAFVGRERELDRLRAVRRELEAGRGRIVLLSGEAGLGKSRLLAEWRAELGKRARWLEGRSFAHTTGLAYGPFLDLFRRAAGIRDDDSESQARARLRAGVERFFPGDAEAQAVFANLLALRLTADQAALLAALPAEALRRRLFALVEDLFARLARGRPTWVVLEDLHWADASSLELLEHLLPLTARAPLAIVGVFRPHPDEPPRNLEAVAEAGHADRLTRVALTPLPDRSSLAMVEQLLATPDLPATLQAMIVRRAEGNPFFVEEVIRALIERGALVRAEEGPGWVATSLIESVSVPDTLQGLLMARLDRLPDETRRVVQQAAVIGRIFLYRVLLQIAERTDGLDADLSHLEREELIRERARDPEVEYIFKHALTQEVAYQSLLAPRRRELHRKVGEAIEVVFADRLGEFHAILAAHYLRGEVWDKAAHFFMLAGDAAARLYAHAEARQHYGQALEALARLPDTAATRRDRVDTTLKRVAVAFAAEDPERHLARLVEAEGLARSLPAPDGTAGGDRLRLARVQFWQGRAHFYRNETREAIGYYRQVLPVAQELGDDELLAIPASVIGRALGIQGHFGKAAALLAQAMPPLERTANWPEWVWTVGYHGACIAALGRCAAGLAEAERAHARALEIEHHTAIIASHILLASLCETTGDLPRMAREGHATVELAERSGDRVYVYIGLAFRAWAESRLGRHEAAQASMARSREVGRNIGGQLVLSDRFAAAAAEIAVNAGRVDEALAGAEQAVAVAQAVGGIFAEGVARRAWGRALARAPAGWDEAAEQLAASVRLFAAGDCRVDVARTQLTWGLLCRDHGDLAGARDHLEHAVAHFEATDLADELARARGLLAALGPAGPSADPPARG